MHHAKHSQTTGQTILVLRILNLQSRNSHEQARVSFHENSRQKAGARNLPRVAQSRVASAKRKTERGCCPRTDCPWRERWFHSGQRRIAAERLRQAVVPDVAASEVNQGRRL